MAIATSAFENEFAQVNEAASIMKLDSHMCEFIIYL